MNREQWLSEAAQCIYDSIFKPHDIICPEIKYSVARPAGKAKSWTIDAIDSADQSTYHIFISSEMLDKTTVLELLFGELVYVLAGKKPTKAFKRTFSLTRVGKRWYPDIASDTYRLLMSFSTQLPPYPHVAVVVEEKEKKQTSRMLKIICHSHEEPIILRGARLSFENGFPTCICGAPFVPDGWVLNEEENQND